MTGPEHVAQPYQSHGSENRPDPTVAVPPTSNDELPAMLERATHAQAAVNLSSHPAAQLSSNALSPGEHDQLGTRTSQQERDDGAGRRADETSSGFPGAMPRKADPSSGRARNRTRISFEEFASQLRLHRYHEHKVELLRRRQVCLRKSIALSTRLHRVGSMIHDGLFELSAHGDKAGFVRVYQYIQELVDILHTQWKREVGVLDPSLDSEASLGPSVLPDSETFVPKLSASSRTELFGFIHSLRSNAQFLVERIKSLSPQHLLALTKSRKPRELAVQTLSPFQKHRSSQKKRFEAFSHGLEDYALSFERASPVSFLLFNVFGSSPNLSSPEYRLRLRTWSTVCTALVMDCEQQYHVLVNEILSAFASTSIWRARERLELFLMDILQKGSFLLELAQSSSASTHLESPLAPNPNPFGTQEAEEFFDQAVLDLFRILDDQHGGFPESVLQLGCSILGQLPSIEEQSNFRGQLFGHWFLQEFLQIALTYPENERMLLQCHISKEARNKILYQLWMHADSSANDVFRDPPLRRVNDDLRIHVMQMIGRLGAVEMPQDPYDQIPGHLDLSNEPRMEDSAATPFLAVSATDVVRVIDALFPPSTAVETWDPFVSSSATAFSAQYSHTTTRLDKLRREIILLSDMATQSRSPYPSQENWILLLISENGKAIDSGALPRPKSTFELLHQSSKSHDTVQRAALRLIESRHTPFGSPSSTHSSPSPLKYEGSLEERFQTELQRAQSRADTVAALHWYQALGNLSKNYPSSTLAYDDTRVLAPVFYASLSAQQSCEALATKLETNFLELRYIFDHLKTSVSEMSARLDKIRTKMWYSVDVINSNTYEDAKNIASALNNMAIPTMEETNSDRASVSSRGRRPPSSSSSSLLDQPREDTINILKAPVEHGGPKKLADSQLELTRKWLQRNSVDNFCKGEERIHRFCMEIKMAAKKLVGESLTDSPVLWSSELFQRERSFYESNPGPASAQMSTRAPSIISEVSSNFQPARLNQRSVDSAPRSHLFETHSSPGRKSSFHSLGSGRVQPDFFATDRSSSGSSPGRAVSATTTDSLSSIWSPHPTYSQSATSVSVRSRPASTYNDIENAKIADQSAQEKSKFLESLQHDLLCMLLSDLGCPVWSSGSETDAWLQKIFKDEMIQRRLKQRVEIGQMVAKSTSGKQQLKALKDPISCRTKRSVSAAPRMTKVETAVASATDVDTATDHLASQTLDQALSSQYPYYQGYQELFSKLTQEIDPIRKLQALNDCKKLAVAEAKFGREKDSARSDRSGRPGSLSTTRRSSFDPRMGTCNSNLSQSSLPELEDNGNEPEETKTIQLLKGLLMKLRPKTLFRDLQYISAFVSSDTLNKTESGRAFLHFGLAALAYKDEMCRSMVDVADKVIAKDVIKRKTTSNTAPKEPSLMNIAEFWIFAAREGNPVAQRELGSLYLTCPERIPIVSLPLSLSSETFRNEMVWQEATENTRTSQQKLCLALHWMQQASINGDEVAKRKLKERETQTSISIQ